MSAVVKSIEDHGYSFDLGIPDISGFLSFPTEENPKYLVGQVMDVTITKISSNQRVCSVGIDKEKQETSYVGLFLLQPFYPNALLSFPKYLPSILSFLVPLYSVW